MDQRFNEVDRRFDRVEGDIKELRGDIGEIRSLIFRFGTGIVGTILVAILLRGI